MMKKTRGRKSRWTVPLTCSQCSLSLSWAFSLVSALRGDGRKEIGAGYAGAIYKYFNVRDREVNGIGARSKCGLELEVNVDWSSKAQKTPAR